MDNQLKHIKTINNRIKLLNYFWIGFLVYAFSFSLSKTGTLNMIIWQAFQSIGLMIIFYTSYYLIKPKVPNRSLQTVFIIYCVWLLLIILRGFSLDYVFLKDMLFDAQYGMLPYFTPLILLFRKSIFFYKKLFEAITILGILYIIYDVAFFGQMFDRDETNVISSGLVESSALLSVPVGFLLLTFNYHSNRVKIFSVIVIFLILLFAIVRARRGLIFICSTQIIFAYLLYLYNAKKKYLIIATSLILVMLGINYVNENFIKRSNTVFSFLMDRGAEDTRTGVELYFYADLTPKDWIIGKGIKGQYYSPSVEENQKTNYRYVIETGYLQTILRGGIISLLLILAIAIPAIILGLFYSKNTLSKAAGIWIFLWLLYLYPATMEAFTLYYLIFWISIGICYSKILRNIPEKTLTRMFSN